MSAEPVTELPLVVAEASLQPDPLPPTETKEAEPVKPAVDRDVALAELEKGKKMSFIKAWEDSEKSKAENKALKQQQAINTWENTKKAALEADLKKMEEKLEHTKAQYAEKMKNKIALIRKQADEKRAMVEAKKGEENLKVEEMAAKYRATGITPKATCGCF